MIFDLIDDFSSAIDSMPKDHPRHRTLTLLDEAIRRDIHFILRRPTTLFQCMWNTCWWYDCARAIEHYSTPPTTRPTAKRSREKQCLHNLMESWQLRREQAVPGVRWLRSLRPPRFSLGTTVKVFAGHWENERVCSLAVSLDGRIMASGGEDRRVIIWDTRTGRQLTDFATGMCEPMCVALSGDGKLVAVATQESTEIYQTSDGRPIGKTNGTFPNFLEMSEDGSIVVFGNENVHVWDIDKGNCSEVRHVHASSIRDIAISADARRLVSAHENGELWVLDTNDMQQVATLGDGSCLVMKVVMSANGSLVAAGFEDGSVRLWNVDDGRELIRIQEQQSTFADLSMSADGSILVARTRDAKVWVWDLRDGGRLRLLCGESGWNVSASPDGQWFATCLGSAVYVWRLDGDDPPALHAHHSRVKWSAIEESERFAITKTIDDEVFVWELATGRVVDKFEAQDSATNIAARYDAGGERPEAAPIIWSFDGLQHIAIESVTEGKLAFLPVDGGRIEQSSSGRFGVVAEGAHVHIFELEHSSKPLHRSDYSRRQWHFSFDGRCCLGPATSIELKTLISNGALKKSGKVSKDGRRWHWAGNIKDAQWPE